MQLHHVFIALFSFWVGGLAGLLMAGILRAAKIEPPPSDNLARECSWCHRVLRPDNTPRETSHGYCAECTARDAMGAAAFKLPNKEDTVSIPTAPSPDPCGSDGVDFRAQQNARRNS